MKIVDFVLTNPGGTGTTITPTLSSHQAQDILIVAVGVSGITSWAVPAGWTFVDQRSVGTASTGLVGAWMWRRVLSSDVLPLASPTCTLGATVTRIAGCITLRRADPEGPFTLGEWNAKGFTSGTANPISPPTVTPLVPEMLTLHGYFSKTATDSPIPAGYTPLLSGMVSGTLSFGLSYKLVDQYNTAISNQSVSPTGGVRWVSGLMCIPSLDYVYFRSASQAITASGTSVTLTLPAGATVASNQGLEDLLVATVQASGVTTISAQDPTLWTEIPEWTTTTFGDGTSIKKFYAFMTPGANLQFNRTGTGEIGAYIACYRNARQMAPIGSTNVRQNASGTTSTWDALIRRSAKSTVAATCVADATPSYTMTSGWIERIDANGMARADQLFNQDGLTTSSLFNLSAASPTAIGLVELLPNGPSREAQDFRNYQAIRSDSGMSSGG